MRKKSILLNPYFFNPEMIEGAFSAARRYDLALSILQPAYNEDMPTGKKYDGILTAGIKNAEQGKEHNPECKIVCHTLLASEKLRNAADAIVAADESQICSVGVNYLLRKGFSNFACCLEQEREDLFRSQLKKSGIEMLHSFSPLPIQQEVDLESRIEFIRNLPKPCAFFVQTVLWSERWNEVIYRSGVKVPEELAILGIDNLEYICNSHSPQLSAIDTNAFDVGFHSVEIMARLLAGETVPHMTLIAPKKRVVERESTDFYAVGNEKLRQMILFARKHIGEGITVHRLANEFSMTVPSLDELFQRHLRNTPKRFLIELQLKRAEDLLKQGDLTIAAVAKESGFATLSGFYDVFHKYHNTSPKEWCFKR